MKMKGKTLFLALLVAGAAQADDGFKASHEACRGTDCAMVEITIGRYAEPWLTNYVWLAAIGDTGKPFSERNLQAAVIARAENSIQDGLEMYSEEQNWSAAQSDDHFTQVRLLNTAHETSTFPVTMALYRVFDKNTQSVIDSPYLPGGENKIEPLLKQTYLDWQMKYMYEVSREMALSNLPDTMPESDSWYIAKNAIVFHFSNEDLTLGPRTYGSNIELPIDVSKLTGIIRPDILNAAKRWPVPYELLE